MSGVYIKGMEMPLEKSRIIQIYPDGTVRRLDGSIFNSHFEAVPVPKHGDLIDRREAIVDANERAYDFWLSDDEVNATIRLLKEQPTIIPAEEDE